jgi:hypothetical protein
MSNDREGDPAVSNWRCCSPDFAASCTNFSIASSTNTSTWRTPVMPLAAAFLNMIAPDGSAMTTPLGRVSSASATTSLAELSMVGALGGVDAAAFE